MSDETHDLEVVRERASEAKVYSAINAVQAALAVEGIGKDRENKIQNFKFRGIDDMYNAIAPLLAKNRLVILPAFSDRQVVERTSAKGGMLIYVNVAGRFTFVSAEDGSRHTVGPFYGEAMDSGDKATNKAQSAAYKYMCMQTFCIPTEGDNDADATTHVVAARPNTATQVAVDAFTAMSDEEKDFLRTVERDIKRLFADKGDVVGYLERVSLDTENKLAVWSLLPSDVRAWIKLCQRTLTPADYASQA